MERRPVSTDPGEHDGARSPGALVLALLDAYSRGDEAAVLALLHPEIEFVPMLVATGVRREPYRGHAGFIEYLRDSRAVMLDVDIDVRAVHEDRDIVVALAHVTGSAAGGPVEAAVTYVWRVRDGLIVHGIVGADPDRAARSFGLERDMAIAPGEPLPELAPLELHLAAVPQSVPTVRRAVDAYVGAAGVGPDRRHDICLAISEACSNVILHAYLERPEDDGPGPLSVTVTRREGRLVLSVEDEGRGMVARVDSPGLGMGLVVMSRLAAAITITTRPERPAGCRVDMEFAIASARGGG
jgi:anti-sigma regulatory factor (Ser/Thr protein kinase)/ketosteroid isomerase-like protein